MIIIIKDDGMEWIAALGRRSCRQEEERKGGDGASLVRVGSDGTFFMINIRIHCRYTRLNEKIVRNAHTCKFLSFLFLIVF